MTAPRRHLLVIASQCHSMDQLDQLEKAARELHEALLDERLGGCMPGLPGDKSLFYNELSGAEMRTTIENAIRYAGDHGATLVLALLGHGFRPGEASRLYLMGPESVEGDALSAVDVGSLLRDAADRQGVDGVIGIVDTCHAAGSLPSAQELATGQRAGQVRLALLMASAIAQPAFGLQFSLNLTALLRQGIDDAGPFLYHKDIVTWLQSRTDGQTIGGLDYNADPSADTALWLSANARHQLEWQGDDFLGPLGWLEMRSALGNLELGSGAFQEPPWDAEALRHLAHALSRLDFSAQRERALRAVDSAFVAQFTVKFLRSWQGSALNTRRLRSALTYLRVSERRHFDMPHLITDVTAVDSVAFDYPVGDRDCRAYVARFVLLLAGEAGIGISDQQGADRFDRWARSIGGQLQVNDAAEFVERRQKERRLRLVVSLHALAGDWPEAVQAWLLCDGELQEHRSFQCETVDRPGAEGAVGQVLSWADEAADELGLRLLRVDIATSAGLLLKWRPEETLVDNEYLGVNHEVQAHWSQRLDPPRVGRWILKAAVNRLNEIKNCTSGTPIDWLGELQTNDPLALQESLRRGQYMRGIGLDYDPTADTALMELLFSYIPIVLWPHSASRVAAERRSCVDASWSSLPTGFLNAYRLRWSSKKASPLVDLRAAWDDQEWLDFCMKVAARPRRDSDLLRKSGNES